MRRWLALLAALALPTAAAANLGRVSGKAKTGGNGASGASPGSLRRLASSAAPLSNPSLGGSLVKPGRATVALPAAAAAANAIVTTPKAVEAAAVLPRVEPVPPAATAPDAAPQPALGSGVIPQERFERLSRGAPDPARGLFAGPRGFARLRARVLEFVGRHWQLPVAQILDGRDVLLLGESHTSLSSVRTLTESMPSLRQAGVSTIGLEALLEPHQAGVDDYLAGRNARLPAGARLFHGRRAAEYRALMAAAKENGLRVRALGRPVEIWGREAARLAEANGAEPAEALGEDILVSAQRADARYEHGVNEAVAEVLYRRRNPDMADKLLAGLGPGEKTVALVGDSHLEFPAELVYRLYSLKVSDFGDLAAELRKRLRGVFSLTLTGGVFVEPGAREEDSGLLGPLYRLAAELRPGGQPVYFRTSEHTGAFHMGDGIAAGSESAGRTLRRVD